MKKFKNLLRKKALIFQIYKNFHYFFSSQWLILSVSEKTLIKKMLCEQKVYNSKILFLNETSEHESGLEFQGGMVGFAPKI